MEDANVIRTSPFAFFIQWVQPFSFILGDGRKRGAECFWLDCIALKTADNKSDGPYITHNTIIILHRHPKTSKAFNGAAFVEGMKVSSLQPVIWKQHSLKHTL